MSLDKACKRFAREFLVKPGKKARLADHDPRETFGLAASDAVRERHQANIQRLAALQALLFADKRFAVLIVLQGVDAAGKDGAIHHLLTGVNPQGVRVQAFRRPTELELAHDYLWRIHEACPKRGEIAVFNRSHYEDVVAVRVHELVPKKTWSQRFAQINRFERHLVENNTVILKFFLNVSKAEQRRRLIARVKDPKRNWKMELEDIAERKLWAALMRAYEDALTECSTDEAPWHIIPADHKWLRNLAISQIVVDRLAGLGLRYPKPAFDPANVRVP